MPTIRKAVKTATTLAAAYVAGSGSMVLAPAGGGIIGVGTFLVIGPNGNTSAFSCSGVSGDTLTGVTLVEGTDEYFPAGSLIELAATTAGGGGGSGTVTSITATAPLTGGVITTTGSIGLGTTGLTITQHSGAIIVPSGTSGTITMDLSLGDWQAPAAITGTATLALSNPTVGQQFTVILIPGGFTVNWFSGILWPGGTTPTLTATAGKRDVMTFKCVSAGVYLGFVAGQSF